MSSVEATMPMLEAMPEEARLKVLEFTRKLFTSERPANPHTQLTSAQILGDLEESHKQIARGERASTATPKPRVESSNLSAPARKTE